MMKVFHLMLATVYVMECLSSKKAVLACVSKLWFTLLGREKELPTARQIIVYNGRDVPLDSWSV